MTDHKAVMRQALDALNGDYTEGAWAKRDRAIIALREAIAQPAHAFIASDAIECVAQPEQTAPQPAQPDQAGEIAALRKDAERYRWLRSIGHDQMNVLGHYAGDAMDAAIDAAIAQTEQPAIDRNFCPRCGKRLGGVDDVHTCTPTKDKP